MNSRSIPRWLTAGAAVSCVLCSAAGARGQLRIHLDLGHHGGGSVHFDSRRPPPAPPVVPPGAVRYEHYHDRDHDRGRDWDREHGRDWDRDRDRHDYRNPYNDAYFRRFRGGYRPIVVGTTQYYFYPDLPGGYQTVVVNGTTYYLADGVYYQPYIYEGQTVYMVVAPPVP